MGQVSSCYSSIPIVLNNLKIRPTNVSSYSMKERRKGRQEEEREEKSKGGNGKKKENVYMSWFAQASISKIPQTG